MESDGDSNQGRLDIEEGVVEEEDQSSPHNEPDATEPDEASVVAPAAEAHVEGEVVEELQPTSPVMEEEEAAAEAKAEDGTAEEERPTTPATPVRDENPTAETAEGEPSPKFDSDKTDSPTPALTNGRAKEPNKEADQMRKFRIVGAEYPGIVSHPDMVKLIVGCQSCHVWLERAAWQRDAVKRGGISVVFDTEAEARKAFHMARATHINGQRLKLQAHKSFWDTVADRGADGAAAAATTGGELSEAGWEDKLKRMLEDDSEIPTKLYISQLLPSVDRVLIDALFESENIRELTLTPASRWSKTGILTMVSETAAREARDEYDGFVVDDGEVSRAMRIFPYADYLKSLHTGTPLIDNPDLPPVKIADAKAKPEVPAARPGMANTKWGGEVAISAPVPDNAPVTDASGMTVERMEALLREEVHGGRTNWAELNNVSEVWGLVDAVVTRVGWVPDSTLQSAMLRVLEADLATLQPGWIKGHLATLIKAWKKEMLAGHRGQPSQRAFSLAAPEYLPFQTTEPEKAKKFRSSEHRKQVVGLMGIGSMLAAVKETEVPDQPPAASLPDRPDALDDGETQEGPMPNPKKRNKKKRAQTGDGSEVPAKKKKADKKAKAAAKKEKDAIDLEEGEMESSSDSEGGGKSNRRKAATSSSSSTDSSSSDSSDSDGGSDSDSDSKKKRGGKGAKGRAKRKADRKASKLFKKLERQMNALKKTQKKKKVSKEAPVAVAAAGPPMGEGEQGPERMMAMMQQMMAAQAAGVNPANNEAMRTQMQSMMPYMMGMMQQMATRGGGAPNPQMAQLSSMFRQFQAQYARPQMPPQSQPQPFYGQQQQQQPAFAYARPQYPPQAQQQPAYQQPPANPNYGYGPR